MNSQRPTAYDDYLNTLGFESGVFLRAGERAAETVAPPTHPSPTASPTAHTATTLQAPHLEPSSTDSAHPPSLRLLMVGEELSDSAPSSSAPSKELLSKMIQAMGISGNDLRIIEAHSDRDLLIKQIADQNPEYVVIFGNQGAQKLFGERSSVADLRNQFHSLPELTQLLGRVVGVLNTYHPALCLMNPSLKKPVWEDLQVVMKALGLKQ